MQRKIGDDLFIVKKVRGGSNVFWKSQWRFEHLIPTFFRKKPFNVVFPNKVSKNFWASSGCWYFLGVKFPEIQASPPKIPEKKDPKPHKKDQNGKKSEAKTGPLQVSGVVNIARMWAWLLTRPIQFSLGTMLRRFPVPRGGDKRWWVT